MSGSDPNCLPNIAAPSVKAIGFDVGAPKIIPPPLLPAPAFAIFDLSHTPECPVDVYGAAPNIILPAVVSIAL